MAARSNLGTRPSDNSSPTTEVLPEYDQFGHGHYFTKKTFHKPTYCHHCTDMLWGLIGQGFICEGMVLSSRYPFLMAPVVRSIDKLSSVEIKSPFWPRNFPFPCQPPCHQHVDERLCARYNLRFICDTGFVYHFGFVILFMRSFKKYKISFHSMWLCGKA